MASSSRSSVSLKESLLTSADDRGNATESTVTVKERNTMGTFNGCYVPCCLNIMGIILFLRLGWAVGQTGVLGLIGVFALGETMAVITVLSFSAIVTNGTVKGGGSYYLISRTLGPELGGAIGILFYFAYAVGTSFYVIGFATAVQQTWFYDSKSSWTIVIIGSICLVAILGISVMGAQAFSKFNIWFFAIQMISIFVGVISYSFFPRDDELKGGGINTGWNSTSFSNNLFPSYVVDDQCQGSMCSFRDVFAICFPAVTGIMEGANLMGDMKDPAKSVPKGTLLAVATSVITYMIQVFTIAASFSRETLQTNLTFFQDSTFWPMIIVTGLMISALSSALGSLFGGSRVLQAIARDELFPRMSWLGYGTPKGDEPRYAVLVTYVVAQACLLIGDLDVVAPIITSFFCMSYALCNLTCLMLSLTGAPNFRPSWKYYSWHVSLFGFLLCMGVMFWISVWNASIALVCLTAITIFLYFFGPVTDWGDVTHALVFHQVRKYLLLLDGDRARHTKFWRPSYLVLVQDISPSTIRLCEHTKKGGLLLLGSALQGELQSQTVSMQALRDGWLRVINQSGLKALPQVTVAPSFRLGCQSLMTCGGLGGLDTNTVVLQLLQSPRPSSSSPGASLPGWLGAYSAQASHRPSSRDLLSVVLDALSVEKNVLVPVGFDAFPSAHSDVLTCPEAEKSLAKALKNGTAVPAGRTRIDVWLVWPGDFDFADTASLLLQVAYILHSYGRCVPKSQLRVLQVVDLSTQQTGMDAGAEESNATASADEMATAKQRLVEMLEQARIVVGELLQVEWTHAVGLAQAFRHGDTAPHHAKRNALRLLNAMMRQHSASTSFAFAPLPGLPAATPSALTEASAEAYLSALDELTTEMPPTALMSIGEKRHIIATTI